ncbi:MAG: bile acid:sodium symporter family protein [Pseudomonadales bacterium]
MFEFYLSHEYWFAAIQLGLAMLGMGATLAVSDFLKVLAAPKAISTGLLLQLCAVPLLALLYISVLGLNSGIAIAIALIASIPGGTTSNVFTYLAGGNTPLSITITGVSTLACLFTTPFILQWLTADAMPDNFNMPVGQIAFEIGVCLLIPLFVGMLVHRLLPNHAAWVAKWGVRASLFVILLIVIGASGSGRLDIDAFGGLNVAYVLGFTALLVLLGVSVPRLLGLSNRDATAIEMEVVVRNTNLGILVNASLFPTVAGNVSGIGGTILFALLLYGGMQLLLAMPFVFRNRRHNSVAR